MHAPAHFQGVHLERVDCNDKDSCSKSRKRKSKQSKLGREKYHTHIYINISSLSCTMILRYCVINLIVRIWSIILLLWSLQRNIYIS